MPSLPSFLTVPLVGKIVLVRVDFNVPIKNGTIEDLTRLETVIPTLLALRDKQARVILLSHRGRPKGKENKDQSLEIIIPALSRLLEYPVKFCSTVVGPKAKEMCQTLKNGEVLLLENLRFHPGEESNDPTFVKELASLGDIYINDAFAVSHRAHASVEGITAYLPSYSGLLLESEIFHLSKSLASTVKPLMAIIGGAKISTKLGLLETLIQKVDFLALGGGISNTFLLAQGKEIGRSLCEIDQVPVAHRIQQKADQIGCQLLLPKDVVVAQDATGAGLRVTSPDAILPSESIFDLGPQTENLIEKALKESRSVIWNGPLGFFEQPPFDQGSIHVASLVGRLTKQGHLSSLAGGGETVAVLKKAGIAPDFTYLSTGGGAFLEYLEGLPLPGLQALLSPINKAYQNDS